jgi:ABC-2 type transport system permease protein
MKKLFIIGFKDLKLTFRDKAALIFMLLAPFLLTLGMGAVTGSFSKGSSGIQEFPVILVNQDNGQIGNALVEVFQSKDLSALVEPTLMEDVASAKQAVDENKAAGAIIIPAGFTQSIIPAQVQATIPSEVVQVELYSNPTMPTSVGVLKTILDEFMNQVEVGRVGGEVAVTSLITSGRIQVQDAAAVGQAMGISQANASAQSQSITLKNVTPSGKAVEFSMLALLAPGMALMFLMYTTTNGGRMLLAERNQGTLPRLLVSPTTGTQVLGGKVVGIFLTGTVQMLILIVGTALLFNLQWGDPLALLVLVMAAVFGATGWGMLITAIAKTPGQVAAIGSAIMLSFGILGGSFFSLDFMASWFRLISKISPNAWGMDGFTTLALGGTLVDIWQPILALLVMGALLFAIAVVIFNRRGMMSK